MNLQESSINRIILMIVAAFGQVALFAQDKGVDVNVDINKGGGGAWYANPYVIAVGVALFILLLVALMRGNQSRTT